MGQFIYLLFARDVKGMLCDAIHARLNSKVEYYCPYCGTTVIYQELDEMESNVQQHFFKHSKEKASDRDNCAGLFLNEAIKVITYEILENESSLYVSPVYSNGTRYAPDKIFKPKNSILHLDESIGTHMIDLKWNSEKGKTMGLLFVDHDDVIENKIYDIEENNAFVVEINIGILKNKLRTMIKTNTGLNNGVSEAVKSLLSRENKYSRWVHWEGKSSSYRMSPAQFKFVSRFGFVNYRDITSIDISDCFDPDYTNNYSSSQNTKNIMRLTKRNFDYENKEITYQFIIEQWGRSDTFYLVIYDNESILLDYVHNSVPVNSRSYSQVKTLCLSLIRIYEDAMAGKNYS